MQFFRDLTTATCILKAGIAFNIVDLSQAQSIDDIVDIGKDYIQKNHCRKGDWILGRGWNQIYLKEQRMPDRRDLTGFPTHIPSYLPESVSTQYLLIPRQSKKPALVRKHPSPKVEE